MSATPAQLAAFVTSSNGRLFNRVQRENGRSPGAVLFPEDDVRAYDIDLAFFLLGAETAPQSTGKVVTDLEARMRAMGDG